MMNAIPRERDPDLTSTIPIFLRRLHADSTRAAYAREITRFTAWLADNSPLDAEVLPRYVEWLRTRSLSPTFIAWRATVIGEFLCDAHRQGVIAMDVTAGYKKPKGTRGFAPRVLSSGELKRLLRTPDRRSWKGKRDLAALVLMGIGGLRAGEVCSLRLCDVDVRSEGVTLRVNGKGNRLRTIAFEGKNASPLRSWAAIRGTGVAHSPWLVARKTEEGEQPRRLSVAMIDYVVRTTARSAELTGVHAHALRHSAASLALANGANLIEVRDMLGHASVITTSRYLHASALTCPVAVRSATL
ncbi:MAG: tyrosine-type recombinase/integrase [bacterium]